jgi:hypothetical protein
MNPADQSIQGSLPEAESALGLVFDVPDGSAPFSSDPTERGVDMLLERMQMHVLVISVLYYTLIGDSKAASPRLSRLHQLLDVLALTKGADAFLTVGTHCRRRDVSNEVLLLADPLDSGSTIDNRDESSARTV